jgi:hypothetical protein
VVCLYAPVSSAYARRGCNRGGETYTHGAVPQNPQTPYVVAIAVIFGGVTLFRIGRWLLAITSQRNPRNLERQQAIAALCEQRGMVPNPINLYTVLSAIFPMALAGQMPVYENSFASPDGSLWVADMWTPRHDDNNRQTKEWDPSSMVAFNLPGVNLPYVGVTRKGQKNPSRFTRGSPLTLESIDFDERFAIRAEDRRSAVMLLDQGMMQWLLDCDQVSFEITGDRVQALARRSSEPTYQPGLVPGWNLRGQSDAPHSYSRRADPVELELLLKFADGFAARVPELVRSEFAAGVAPA